jgi:hypothetical protein
MVITRGIDPGWYFDLWNVTGGILRGLPRSCNLEDVAIL